MRLGIEISYSQYGHPQTNGKDERFHRTLNIEVIQRNYFRELTHAQEIFDNWRQCYNLERPHEAIDLNVPNLRYTPSYRSFPEKLPGYEYDSTFIVKRVDCRGRVNFQGKSFFTGMAFAKELVGVQRTQEGGIFNVYFCNQKINKLDVTKKEI